MELFQEFSERMIIFPYTLWSIIDYHYCTIGNPVYLHKEDKRLIRSESIFTSGEALRGLRRSFVIIQEHALYRADSIAQRIPCNTLISPVAQNQSLLVLVLASIRKHLLAGSVHDLPVTVHEQVQVPLAQLKNGCPEVIRGIGVTNCRCGIDSDVVIIHGHPGSDIGTSKTAIRVVSPLNWGACIVPGLFPILSKGSLLGCGIKVLALDQSIEEQ